MLYPPKAPRLFWIHKAKYAYFYEIPEIILFA